MLPHVLADAFSNQLPREVQEVSDRAQRYELALDRLSARPPVTVVVPIHNAPGALTRCLDTLATMATAARIVLVDDHSTEPQILRICQRFAEEHSGTRIVSLSRNEGFVAAVNAGVGAADGDTDIVLLNSDTRVTPAWLEKLSTASLLEPDVATVSPLSNAAGIFSIPRAHLSNELPEGWEPEHCNLLLEEVSPRARELVPATSGFCLYVRRAAIEAIGLFDEMLFRRGYGEENDFCARASAAGMRHVVDDSTFIFHEREASFGGSKAALKLRNTRVLKALQPSHTADQLEWERDSRLGAVRDSYSRALGRLTATPRGTPATVPCPLSTRLCVAPAALEGAPEPQWTKTHRLGVLRLSDAGARWSAFGVGEYEIAANGPGLVAWLVERTGARQLDVLGGALEDDALRRLQAAFPWLTSSPVAAVQ